MGEPAGGREGRNVAATASFAMRWMRLDLRQQLADTRAERDRYIARCAELEGRLQQIREVVR